MDATKSYVKIYNISPQDTRDFEFDYDTASDDLLTEMVPRLDEWGDIGWMEVDEYEYNPQDHTMHLTLSTKLDPPLEWLRRASVNVPYLANKLILMNTIRKDEALVTGMAVMEGETLQNKCIFERDPEEISEYYNDNGDDDALDELDNQIWDSISKFVNVCEQFYLEREEEND